MLPLFEKIMGKIGGIEMRKIGIKTRIVVSIIFAVIIVATTTTYTSVKKSGNSMEQLQDDLLKEKLNIGLTVIPRYIKEQGYDINEIIALKPGQDFSKYNELLDIIKSEFGIDVTFFVRNKNDKFMRMLTTILDKDLNRAAGTTLNESDPQAISLLEGNTYIGNAKVLGESYMTAYQPIEVDGKVVAAFFTGVSKLRTNKEINTYLNELMFSGVSTMGLFIALFVVISFLLANSVVKPIKKIANISRKIADLDLTEEIPADFINRRDEVGILGNAFSDMKIALGGFLQTTMDSSVKLETSAKELSKVSKEISTSASEVSRAIDEIATGATDQAGDTERGAAHSDELGKLMMEEQANLQELNRTTNRVGVLKDEGTIIIKELQAKFEQSEKAARDVTFIISETNESANRISKASHMIKDIARQTNLLALNAAIEAARAGEAGRGFAVVADEIRNLAEESNRFTKEIENIVKELLGKSENAVVTMNEVGVIMADQGASVVNTIEKFEGIAESIETVKIVIHTLNESSIAMDSKKNEIISIMQSLSAISEENAAGSEEAFASVEQQTEAMSEIALSCEQLLELAEELNTGLSKFKF
jgi:methyl-accepting chemotaxis protein